VDFKLPRQLRIAAILIQVAGLVWNPALVWLGFFILILSYAWSVGIVEDYFIALSKANEEPEKKEEENDTEN
jgi:hypothetical protein